MPLFQQAIIGKYIADVPKQTVDEAWLIFQQHFHNTAIQQNIRNAKEEQYQEGFLRELFVAVFGYTLNPQPDFNLTTEYKNEKDSKKADGAILHAGQVTAIIELKGTETTDLGKVESQAFNYKNNQKSCTYVITSNFEKLRFYINDAVEWEEFDLFTLSFERFALLYVCLHKDNLLSDVPLQMKQASVAAEENITRKLYADYSQFKKKLFHNITSMNPQHDKLLLFKKTQKLLDRFLFIFFGEDRLLLPPKSVREILKQWEQLKELDNYVPLYQRFKKYFGYLNTGHKGKLYEIFAYNGGLFATDELLDSILIDDEILYDSCVTLSNYNFESEVDVNILGHIFEHSLNEIEELEKSLVTPVPSVEDDTTKATVAEAPKNAKATSRRKKDGVFYTPRYITKYIVENTVGALCAEQKKTLGIAEDEFTVVKRKANRKQLLDKIESYRKWLLQLTICDPACGSGAFLNQALEFLIAEHRYIDEMKAKLFGDAIVLSDVENVILENNLFGVDINDEAVEIARLSLWLRTAKKGRKLNRLTNNIQCGNSLIDDPKVAGDKAFDWKKGFPAIFEKGGFDVVIGNPPYVSHDRIDNKGYLKVNYSCYNSFTDLYSFFFEKGIAILKENGYLYFITSNSFLRAEYGTPLRKILSTQTSLVEIINIDDSQIFGDAIVNTVMLCFVKGKFLPENLVSVVNKKFEVDKIDFLSFVVSNKFYYPRNIFKENSWSLVKPELLLIGEKMKTKGKTLEQLQAKIRLGLATGDNNAFVINEKIREELIKKDIKNSEVIKPVLRGRDIERFYYKFEKLYLLLTRNEIDVINDYPFVYDYLNSFGESFKKRGAKGRHWTNLRACSFFDDFKEEKIVWIELSDKGRFTLATDEIYLLNSAYFLLPPKGYDSKYLLSILNSRATEFYLKLIANTSGMGTLRWINIYVKELIIPELDSTAQVPFIEKSDSMLNQYKSLQNIKHQLLQLLQNNFPSLQLTNKLEQWSITTFGEIVKELAIQKIKLTLSQQAEWMQYFEEQKAKAQQIQQIIAATDKEIDKMVYDLYELTEEEIAIMEVQG